LLAGDSARWQGGKLVVSLDCRESATPAALAANNQAGFVAALGPEWTRLPTVDAVTACARDDGQWRYDQAPMQLIRKD
jgi:hypothetical protein